MIATTHRPRRPRRATTTPLLVVAMLAALLAATVSATPARASAAGGGLVSDDFSAGLDPARWTTVDPIGGGAATATGQGTDDAVVALSVPGGTSHDPWHVNRSVRIMQAVANGDFTTEVKFDTLPTKKYQGIGLILEQDTDDWLRFDVFSNGAGLTAFAAATTNGTSSSRLGTSITATGSIWLRVARNADTFTYSWSNDGTTWNTVGAFNHALTLSAVGPFASNHNPAPAFTAAVDYVFDTATPVVPEDPTGPDTTPPVISNLTATPTTTDATITWTTNEPGTTTVDHGTTTSYGTTTTGPGNTTSHQVTLTGLDPATTYHYRARTTDTAGNTTTTNDHTFTTTAENEPTPGGGLVSDDFSAGLDPARWTTVDPIGGGAATATGQGTDDAVVALSVPGGTSHDPWHVNRSVRIMQAVANGDFTTEVKFDTLPTKKYQGIGLILEQDTDDWLRFDVFSNGAGLTAFAAATTNGTSSSRLGTSITATGSIWLRVARNADTFTYSWSNDGTTWNTVGAFNHALTLSAVGPFASNHNPAPAFTAAVDYVFDTATPVVPEDPTGPDTTPPVISNLTATPTTTDATITWTTNEPGTTTVDHGTTTSYGTTTTGPGNTTSHQVTLTGLDPATTYHYRARTTDTAGNTTTTNDHTFTTTAATGGGAAVRIMPAGDSITGGNSREDPGVEDTYRYRLLQLLDGAKQSIDMVGPYDTHPSGAFEHQGGWDHDSFAVAGWTSQQVRDNIAGALANDPADIVLLLVGINDLNGVSPEVAATRVGQVIDTARGVDPGISMLVAEIPPNWALAPEVAEYNALLRDLVADRTSSASPLWTVDLNSGFDVGTMTTDGTHPDDEGEAFLAERWADALATHYDIRDDVPPTISNLDVTVSGDTATVTWTTDELATSRVEHGPTTAYGTVVTDDSRVTSHVVQLTGLPSGTNHLRVSSTDASGNRTTSGDVAFSIGSQSHTLSVTAVGQGTVTTDPAGPDHPDGTVVTVAATPAAGWGFAGWSGGRTSNANPLAVTMDGDVALVATFTSASGPDIDVWYGDDQVFGANGRPQRWVNVLGNVADGDGVGSLGYRLNGGTLRPLTVGPDLMRLQFAGDFNAEIAWDELAVGTNTVRLVAEDTTGQVTTRDVTVTRQAGSASLPTLLDWSSANGVTDLVQVVDGKWGVAGGVLRPTELGYDRIVAVGDQSWTDYEVTMPVTVHALGPDSGTPQSGAPLIGMGLRWPGHEPSAGAQPSTGFYPVGAYAWYRWQNGGRNELTGNFGSPIRRVSTPLELGTPYVMKARVQTVSDGTRYQYKMWRAGDAEPDWQMQFTTTSTTDSGGVILIAHHVDASIGDVTITAVP